MYRLLRICIYLFNPLQNKAVTYKMWNKSRGLNTFRKHCTTRCKVTGSRSGLSRQSEAESDNEGSVSYIYFKASFSISNTFQFLISIQLLCFTYSKYHLFDVYSKTIIIQTKTRKTKCHRNWCSLEGPFLLRLQFNLK